ncbi:sigma-54 interaction domain-containing protein [Bacilliculturomica massiliensis]|uniref:sigma-54 interaction domain-containing protein n=1 Tax=Bacilliculturomica massiliensis TaxID=1917867 RepID=UPI00102FDE30|nr:sigma 54-interacting transcriptional regulator [Bacilliculturomica massiliensis]
MVFGVDELKLNSVDYIVIVNRDFSIVYNSRYDPRIKLEAKDSKRTYMAKSFFEAYPTINRKDSTVLECMSTGEVVVRKFQRFTDYWGKSFCTHNVTLPVIRNGEICAVIELAKDVSTVNDVENELDEVTARFDEDVEKLRRAVEDITFDSILTVSEEMRNNIEKAKILARLPNPTLIYGETGTGKELFAQAMIHDSGVPRNKVIIQNCAAVPDGLMESILFGTVKGAYTGAENSRGLFEQADGGVLFLDELSSMPYQVQGQLLRVLQDGTFRPVGCQREKQVSVKIIAAMNVEPMKAIKEKLLRDDLFYRFTSSMITLPALRERKEDIPFYLNHYIGYFSRVYNRRIREVSPSLQKLCESYDWPGNVRELKHLVEAMVGFSKDETLDVRGLPSYMFEAVYTPEAAERSLSGYQKEKTPTLADLSGCLAKTFQEQGYESMNAFLRDTEKRCIEEALKRYKGNCARAADFLGIPRPTLVYRMEILGVDRNQVIRKE